MNAPITDPCLLAVSDYALSGETWGALPEHVREMFRAHTGRVWREEHRMNERTREVEAVMVFRLSGAAWRDIQDAIAKATPLPA